MNTENILARVIEARNLLDAHLSNRMELDSLIADLEAKLRLEIASKNGKADAVKVVTAMLKPMLESRPGLAYPWVDDMGRQCICDGFVAFRLRNHLPLPERPDNIGDHINLDAIFPADTAGYQALEIPSEKAIREFISVEHAKYLANTPKGARRHNVYGPKWDFGPTAPTVNARYLLNARILFPDAKTILWRDTISPLYIADETGDALLLPIRVQDKPVKPEPASAERPDNIRNAFEAFNAANEKAAEAQMAKHKAHIEAEAATDEAAKAEAMQRYYECSIAEGKARLEAYDARLINEPGYCLTPEEFERIARCLYPHDYEYTAA